MSLLLIFIIIVFLAGLYFVATYNYPKAMEGLANMNISRCPNMLIQKGTQFYLYNSNLAQIPGVNPIVFENLEDYVEFIEWQRSQGIQCPVLYLQQGYDAQGNTGYKLRPSVTEPQGGLPPAPSTQVFNSTTGPNYGGSTTLNQPTSNSSLSNAAAMQQNETSENLLFRESNPMDDDWQGTSFTQQMVDNGFFAGNEVSIYVA